MENTTVWAKNYSAEIPLGDIDPHEVPKSLVITYVVIGVLGVCGNLWVIIVISTSPQMRKKLINILFTSQSFLDLLCGLLLILTCKDKIFVPEGGHFGIKGILKCFLWDSKHLPWAAIYSSTYNLVFINLERWICLTFPLYYKTSLKKRHVFVMCAFSWFIGPVFNSLKFGPTTYVTEDGICMYGQKWKSVFWNQFTAAFTVSIFQYLPLFIIILLNISIYFTLRRQAVSGPDKHSKASVRLNEAAENMLKTTFLLSTAFCICTIPCTIWYLLFELNVQGFSLDSNVYHLSVVAIFCNCCINPFLYSLKYREFKYAAKKLLCKYEFGQDRHGHSINSTLTSLPSVT